MSSMVPDDAPKPRLCHVKKRADFNGYGFNLHAEKGKAGQFIGKIDPESPSERAHLKEGDRIVEVNGTNIGNENHQQVVQRVKAIPDETKLLVVDTEADEYYKQRKIVVRGDMPNVMIYNSDGDTQNEIPVTNGLTNDTSTSSQDVPDDAPRPRNCHLKIWPDFQGFGFNLHAEKGKPGQYIGNVDDGSPSHYAGLKQGDRIIEVNGDNIAKDNHSEVVKKIKSDPNETVLLVLDPEAESYYKEKGIIVSSKQSNVDNIVCPHIKPQDNGSAEVEAEVNHVSETVQENTSDQQVEVAEDKADNSHEEPESTNINDEQHQEEATLDIDEERYSDHEDHVEENHHEYHDEHDEHEEEDKAEAVAEYANVNKSAPEPEPESTPVQVETKVNGQTDGEEAAEAISESIREMEEAVADEPTPELEVKQEEEKPEEKVEMNNNADIAQDYDIIANVPKQEEEPAPEPAHVPEPEREPTPEPQPEPASPPVKQPVTVGGISFAGSAKEARERMSRKRRDEVKQQQLSSKDKYNLYMKM